MNKIRLKLSDKKGGFKELLYDNLGIAIVLILFLTISLAIFIGVKGFGQEVIESQKSLKDIFE